MIKICPYCDKELDEDNYCNNRYCWVYRNFIINPKDSQTTPKPAISIKDLNSEQDRILTKLKQVAIDKGHDYNGKQQVQGDTLYNLRVPSILGICDDPIQTCLMNAANKIMRLSSLRTTDPAVKGESFMDSVEDCINYLIYAGLFYKENE